MSKTQKTSCGFVAIIGAPNAGKSTLLNQLVGQKVSIVSHKVQTTRARVTGIAMHTHDAIKSQIIFVDTPGIFQQRKINKDARLEKAMVHAAWQGANDADIIAFIYDAQRDKVNEDNQIIMRELAKAPQKKILILNKIDQIKREKLLVLAERLHAEMKFEEIFMISALNGEGTDAILDYLTTVLPESVFLYPEDQASDMPLRLMAAEITREKLFVNVHDEIPYACAVETESVERFNNGDTRLSQIIYVERDSQKMIILGKGGAMIKRIGSQSRPELEQLFETKVHLNLFVKVRDNWKEKPEHYSEWGLEF